MKSEKKGVSMVDPPVLGGVSMVDPPVLELNPNPSMFRVFATIRQAVMEKKLREESLIFLRSVQGLSEENEETEEEERSKESPIKVLFSVFTSDRN